MGAASKSPALATGRLVSAAVETGMESRGQDSPGGSRTGGLSVADGPARAASSLQPLGIGRSAVAKSPSSRQGVAPPAGPGSAARVRRAASPGRPGCKLSAAAGTGHAESLHTSSETGDALRKHPSDAKSKGAAPPDLPSRSPPPFAAKESAALASPGSSDDDMDDDDDSGDSPAPPPARMTVDKSRRDRNYLGKVRLYVEQEPFRIRAFAADAIANAEARGQRLHMAMREDVRPSSPRPALLDAQEVALPTCPICEANPASLVAIPCDHCCMCSECAARHRIMSVASATAERHDAERSLMQADQLERAAKTRADALRMAISSGRADLALSPGAQEAIEADMREARSRRAAARYVQFMRPRTACPVCNFRIDAVLALSRVAQLRRSYGGANQLTDDFKAKFVRQPPVARPALRSAAAAAAAAASAAGLGSHQFHQQPPASEDPREDAGPDLSA